MPISNLGKDAFRPTTHDIARVAGVSLSSVDRVLNGRAGVSDHTRLRVNEAICELGYVRDIAAANLALGRTYDLLFILPDSDNAFISALAEHLHQFSKTQQLARTRIKIMKVRAFDIDALADILAKVSINEFQGIALFGLNSPRIDTELSRLRDEGVALVALVSDLPKSSRRFFVGIDNLAAGRTAAKLLGRFLNHASGQILVITGSKQADDHNARVAGFTDMMQCNFANLEILPSVEGLDDLHTLSRLLPQIFAQHSNIIGIYSAAAGNEELVRFLKAKQLQSQLTVIGHELTDHSRKALQDGVFDAIISQDAGHLIRSATRLLHACIDRTPFDAGQERIRIDIYIKENIPENTELIQSELSSKGRDIKDERRLTI